MTRTCRRVIDIAGEEVRCGRAAIPAGPHGDGCTRYYLRQSFAIDDAPQSGARHAGSPVPVAPRASLPAAVPAFVAGATG